MPASDVGELCNKEEKCGEQCPDNACKPFTEGCSTLACFECDRGPNDEPLYVLQTNAGGLNCLNTGTAVADSGEEYKWAITCGPMVSEGLDHLNFGPGEYLCGAWREGHPSKITRSFQLPCQYIQLGECGCAPLDVFNFDLDPPENPCRTEEDCPFLCSDAGTEKASQLCYAFPGDIKWWEGKICSFFS